MKEMICNFRYLVQSTMAREVKMPLIRGMIAKMFGLPILGIKITSRKRYSKDLGKYFLGAKANHYVQGLGYVISKALTLKAQNMLEARKRLEALGEIWTF